MKKCFTLLFIALTFSLSVQAAAPTCGLTIITHAFQPPSYPHFNPGYPFPAWPHEMALAITNRIEAPIHIYRVCFDPNNLAVRLMDGDTSIDISGGAIIILDWSDVSWDPAAFSAQDVADYFFDYLFGETQLTVKPDDHSLAEIPIHMIGHSRDGSVNARLVWCPAND